MTEAAVRPRATRVGVVSDTHGAVPLSAFQALAGVDMILHAGDVCTQEVVLLLETVAPVTAVRGNCDTAAGLRDLPAVQNILVAGVRVLLVHDLGDAPRASGARVVVSGHTHRADATERDGVLYLNPGSASGSRGAGATLALLTIGEDGAVEARILALTPDAEL